MKLEVNSVEVQTNMVYDESVEMGIGHDAIPMVIERLISAYNNPEQAVLREYTSNAYDVHVEQGITRPVEVDLPSPLAPSLRIRDYGVGLSREELKGFGQFGQSTKRETNELTGGFGLGSKSGLAVASQFIVTSIKDGKRNTVVVARDKDNRPHMNFLAEAETDDESGTLITIPIADKARLGDLSSFFMGWKPGSILIDGEQPKFSVHDENYYRPVAGGIGWRDLQAITSPRDMVRVVINQVYYLLDYRKFGLTYNQWGNLKNYIIKIDNGSVKIAPSREDLIYNTPTKEALIKRMDEVLQIARVDFMKEINDAPTIAKALQARERMLNSGYPGDGVTYKGKPILLPGDKYKGDVVPNPVGTWASPSHVGHTKTGWMVEKTYRRLANSRPWNNSDYRRFMVIHSAGPAADYYTNAGQRTAHREVNLVGDWLNTVSDATSYTWEIFITEEPLNRLNKVYLGLADVVLSAEDFNEVANKERAERLVRERSSKSLDTRLQVIVGSQDSRRMSVQDIKNGYDHVIVLRNLSGGLDQMIRESLLTKKNYNRHYSNFAINTARKAKAAIIAVGKNDDLTDLFPLLPPVTTFGKLAAEAVLATIVQPTKYEKMAIRDRTMYSTWAVSKLSDDSIKKIKRKPTQKWVTALRDYKDNGSSIRESLEWLTRYYTEVQDAFAKVTDSTGGKLGPSPIERYPLLHGLDAHKAQPGDIVEYINLKDAALEG